MTSLRVADCNGRSKLRPYEGYILDNPFLDVYDSLQTTQLTLD